MNTECKVCQDEILPDDEIVKCDVCGDEVHYECSNDRNWGTECKDCGKYD